MHRISRDRPAPRAKESAETAAPGVAGPSHDRLTRLSTTLNAPLQAKAPAETGRGNLPPSLRQGVEALSGVSMKDVRVHYNSDKPAQMRALAHAQGDQIHLAPGQAHHLPHEAWHVAQQAQGRVPVTGRTDGGAPLNADPALEREADQMGRRALQMKGNDEDDRS